MVRRLIWTNIFFQQTALKALEMQNKADEKSYKKSVSQLKDMLVDESFEEKVTTESASAVVSAPPSPHAKPKRSSLKDMPANEILKDFAVVSSTPEPEVAPATASKPKKTVHWAEGANILDVRIMPKQYDPMTKKVCFYSEDEIKKFRFEKYLEDHEEEFEEVVEDGEFEWIEEEIIEIEEGFEFEEVIEYVYEDDAVSI